jgi:energy-coupling factor transporter ATP-binding protein EcfA2
MYIRKVEIKNIRSISDFSMEFPEGKEAGWHVLIGDNGAGKSTIVRSVAAVLIGPEQIAAVLPFWDEWLSKGKSQGSIELQIKPDLEMDKQGRGQPTDKNISAKFFLKSGTRVTLETNIDDKNLSPRNYNWGNNQGWFSVAYGPFRRFTGGDPRWNKVYFSAEKAGAHLSVFGEDIALTEALDWLRELDRRHLKEREIAQNSNAQEPSMPYNSVSGTVLEFLKSFLNSGGLLPHGTYFKHIDIDGDLVFEDGNGQLIKVTQLSDGFRSILSLIFELLRQLTKSYTPAEVFKNIKKGHNLIDLPGVVVIDEVDAHLHPTWQTRIGQWFTQYFPNLQFIVTSHSPLICRACEKGSIWRLAAPGSDRVSGEVTGEDKDKLIYGDVLDAYETNVFGAKITRGEEGREKQEEYRSLVYKENYGQKMSGEEKKQLKHLKTIFHTDVALDA